tara:strand:- start:351 stop:1001 length:651 start_codon:yes stop_codon:yes gene_type:complete
MNVSRQDEIAAIAVQALCNGVASDFAEARAYAMEQVRERTSTAPDNLKIHEALVDYLNLFEFDSQRRRMSALRQLALEAMDIFAEFEPRLVGPVLYGTALEEQPIALQVFSGEIEAISRFMLAQRIHFRLDEVQLRFSGKPRMRTLPVFEIEYSQHPFDIYALPSTRGSDLPLSRLDGRPMRRASMAELSKLIESGELFVGVNDRVRTGTRPATEL